MASTNAYRQNTDGTWSPAIPEPFWIRTWRTLLRWRPACFTCSMGQQRTVRFRTRDEYEEHFRKVHDPAARWT